MDDTKAISPEVKGLFETIKSQAKEYEKAFKYIEIEKLKLDQQRSDLERLMDEMRNEVNYTTLKLNQKVQESLKFIESRTEKTIKIYDNLEQIVDLRDSLTQLHGLVKKQVADVENFLRVEIPKTLKEFDNLLKTVRSKSESELDNILGNFRQKMEKYLETETQKLDQKNIMKFRQYDAKLLNFDQRINSIFESHGTDYKRLMDELTSIRNKVTDLTYHSEEIFSGIQGRINSQMEGFNQKRDQLSRIITELETDRQNYGKLLEMNKSSVESLEKSASSIMSKLTAYEVRISSYESKQKLTITLSTISIIAIIIFLLLESGIF